MGSGRGVLRYVAAILLAVVAFASAVATTTIAFGQLVARQDRARAIVTAAFAERAAFVALVDEETGVRGYVATGDPVFLEPYHAGSTTYAAYRAHPVTAPEPAVAAALDAFQTNADALQPYFQAEIAEVARGERLRAVESLPAGKFAFDRMRRRDAAAADALQNALAAGRLATRQATGTARLAMLLMSVVLIAAGTLSTALAVRVRSNAALARRDELTRLPNRRAFEERLGSALAGRGAGERIGVLYVDLDDFKPVNDRLGHAAGDKVLAACGERLRQCVRPADFVARLGGDEFAAIVSVTSSAGAATIAARIVRELEAPFAVEGQTVRLGASIGVAVVPDDGVEPREIVRLADEAMYRTKRLRRGTPV